MKKGRTPYAYADKCMRTYGPPTQGELNSEGMTFYKQKAYPDAANSFRRAIEADPTNALAHYNLACTLSLIRQTNGDICGEEAYRSMIVEHLEKSIELDPLRRERMKSDSDLDSIHDTFGYQRLLGLTTTNRNDVRKILTAVGTWYGPAPGIGPMSMIVFKPGGEVELFERDPNGGPDIARFGTYKILDLNVVSITLDGNIYNGQLSPEGILTIPGLSGPYSDDDDECSA